jgi:putative methionine-R-sulfoxide reductase with GAF domain
MLYIESFLGAVENPWENTIDAIQRDQRVGAGSNTPSRDWPAISNWASALAILIGLEQPTAHVSIFVPDDDGAGLRLAAQVWGAGEDTGEVAVGAWLVPLEGSVCGRVYRTGLAALCADVGMDPDYRPFPGGRTRSSLTVPVGPPGDVLAVINVEAPWVSAFSIRDYERLTERAATALVTFPVRRSG